jgi:DNA-binding CsgD family transcriptional regulator
MKTHILDATKRVLAFGQPSSSGARDEKVVDPPRELTVAGRHYRLVPVDVLEETGATPPSAAELLTPRELQIVALVAEGNVNKQVADVLRISEWTVSTHLRRIFAKLGVDTRAAMVSRCIGATSASRKLCS